MADDELCIKGTPISSLRVVDLKKECDKRGLSKSGTKSQLIERLKTQLLFENKDDSGPTLQLEEEDCQNEFIKQYLAKQKQLIENAESSMNSSSQESDSEDSPKKRQTKSPTIRCPPLEISPEKQPVKEPEVQEDDTTENGKQLKEEETQPTRHSSRRIARIELEQASSVEKPASAVTSSERPSRRSRTRSSQSTGCERGQSGGAGDAITVAMKTTEEEQLADNAKKVPEVQKEEENKVIDASDVKKATVQEEKEVEHNKASESEEPDKAAEDVGSTGDVTKQDKHGPAPDKHVPAPDKHGPAPDKHGPAPDNAEVKHYETPVDVAKKDHMQPSSESREDTALTKTESKEDWMQTDDESKENQMQTSPATVEHQMQTDSESKEDPIQTSTESKKGEAIQTSSELTENKIQTSSESKEEHMQTSSESKEVVEHAVIEPKKDDRKSKPIVEEMSIERSGRPSRRGRSSSSSSSSSSSRSRSPPQQRLTAAHRRPVLRASSSSSSSSRSRSRSPKRLKTQQSQQASFPKQPQEGQDATTVAMKTEGPRGQRSRSESSDSRSRSASPVEKMETEPVQGSQLSSEAEKVSEPSKEASSSSAHLPETKQAKKISLNRRTLDAADKTEAVEDKPAVKRRKWGSQTLSAGLKPKKTSSITISTDSLKELIPDISPALKLAADPILEDEMDYEDDTDHEDPAQPAHAEEPAEVHDTRAVNIQRTVTQNVVRKTADDDKASVEDSDEDSDDEDDKCDSQDQSEADRSKWEERGEERAGQNSGVEEQVGVVSGKGADVESMETDQPRPAPMKEAEFREKAADDLPPKHTTTSPTKKAKKEKKDRNKEIKVIRRLESGAATLITADEPERPARSPSPARNPVTKIVHIRNLVRPFTLHQLKELLGRYGTLIEEDFWIDKIKSHCFASYATVEEAENTRNALHNTRWPQSNPKTLTADFAAQDQLDSYRGVAKPKPAAPAAGKPKELVHEAWREKPSEREPRPGAREGRERELETRRREREQRMKEREERENKSLPVREWDRDKKSREDWDRTMQKSRSRSRDERSPSPRRHRAEGNREASQDRIARRDVKKEKKDDEPPAKLLDDLFKKTKTTPCIYWLPLTELQVQARERQGVVKPKLRQRSVAGDLHSPIREVSEGGGTEGQADPPRDQGSSERDKAKARNVSPDSRRPDITSSERGRRTSGPSEERRRGGSPGSRRHPDSSPVETRRRDSSTMESRRRPDSSPVDSRRRRH